MTAEAKRRDEGPLVARAFLRLSGADEEPIQGPVTRAGEDGWLEVHGWSHAVASPRDAASGLPTGKRQHQPLVITKPIDRTSRRLMQALLDDEVMAEWTLEVRGPREAGRGRRRPPVSDELLEMPHADAAQAYADLLRQARLKEGRRYRIELVNARVSGIDTEMDDGYLGDLLEGPREHVSFTYDRITWVWEDGEVTDDTRLPVRVAIGLNLTEET